MGTQIAERYAASVGAALQCVITQDCPAGWDSDLKRCDGGFFHSPTGADLGGPGGEPLFVRILSDEQVVGIGAGVRRPCRLSMNRTPRHVFFPTMPAVIPGVDRGPVLDALIEGLRNVHAVELILESFDASWSADSTHLPSIVRPREEYVIPLGIPAKARWESLASGHRRQVKKSDRSGLRIESPDGDAACQLLTAVQEEAARRATERGNGFEVKIPALHALETTGSRPWGASMFAAWRDSTPLAAALVGWANRRAFYLIGGSTPDGYECGASIWLHWQITCRLAEAGFVSYNLGGSSPSAASPGDPAHGLHRFKLGFGSRIVRCRSLSWSLSSSHARIHRVGRWLSATAHSSRAT